MKNEFMIANLTHGQTNALFKKIGKQMNVKDSHEVYNEIISGRWKVSEKISEIHKELIETLSLRMGDFTYTVLKDEVISNDDIVYHPKYGIGIARRFLGNRTKVNYEEKFNPYYEKNKSISQGFGFWLHDISAHNCGGKNYDGQLVVIATTNPDIVFEKKRL